MKTLYTDRSRSLGVTDIDEDGFTLKFNNVYGENTSMSYKWDDDWEFTVDNDLRCWGIRDTVEVLEQLYDLEE